MFGIVLFGGAYSCHASSGYCDRKLCLHRVSDDALLVLHVWFPDRCSNNPIVPDVTSLLLVVLNVGLFQYCGFGLGRAKSMRKPLFVKYCDGDVYKFETTPQTSLLVVPGLSFALPQRLLNRLQMNIRQVLSLG